MSNQLIREQQLTLMLMEVDHCDHSRLHVNFIQTDELLQFLGIVRSTQQLLMVSRSLVRLSKMLFTKLIYHKLKHFSIVHNLAGRDLHTLVCHRGYSTHLVSRDFDFLFLLLARFFFGKIPLILLLFPADELTFRPFSWWVSRHNQPMDYWAGALPGSRKCECGILGNCFDPTKWCNCDSNHIGWLEDGGDIKEKEFLPVKAVRFGDTGTPVDEKQGRYTLGPLMCEGDDLFNNVITFRITDSTINLPPFDMGHSGDIYFEFRTTTENAVLFHAKGPTDYIKLSINSGKKLQFEYQAGSGPLGVNVETSYHLNDNKWHSVSVERNRKEARLVVDGALKAEVREPPGPVRALYLTSELVIGATIDFRDGYVGCIRALLLNGKLVDLRSYAERGIYGISTGCVGRCESSPCLNNGTCTEGYDGYTCDCRWSAFKGPICADEIGVNLRSSSMIKYDFLGSWRSTIAESIRVGFTTTNPKGFLLGFTSNITGEYLTLQISNSGHLRVVFDFGFERQELIFPDKHFGLGQYHDVKFSRKNSGSTVVLKVSCFFFVFSKFYQFFCCC